MKLGTVSLNQIRHRILSSEIFQVKWFINLDGDVARRITGTIRKRYEHYSIAPVLHRDQIRPVTISDN